MALNNCDLQGLLKKLDEHQCQLDPAFSTMRQYMCMVELLLMFIRATRTGDWTLYLASVEQLIKYFALDLTNYSTMMSWYVAEMYSLKLLTLKYGTNSSMVIGLCGDPRSHSLPLHQMKLLSTKTER